MWEMHREMTGLFQNDPSLTHGFNKLNILMIQFLSFFTNRFRRILVAEDSDNLLSVLNTGLWNFETAFSAVIGHFPRAHKWDLVIGP